MTPSRFTLAPFTVLLCVLAALLSAPAAGQGGAACDPVWLPTFGEVPGTDGEVRTFATFDDGTGPALYAGGFFNDAGGVPASHVAKWDGHCWSPLGSGLDGMVFALAVFDDGTGP